MHLQLESPKIYVSYVPVDFRKGIDGLSEYITQEYPNQSPDSIYVFHNKSKTKLKMLFWHGNGFVLIQKRLEGVKFTTPNKNKNLEITSQQLSWLVAGLDWEQMKNWKELSYDDYY